ncbi:plasmid maintenance system killer protein [Spirochaetia bacterium]|nr:plasmid maintenance system killer protein [Spirochaetia bacterium]GHU32130.1 plasmid maintenance system killer protein [Spirochaetia bacterium]
MPPDIQARAFNKLTAIHGANVIEDLRIPPSNHLESLDGDRKGQYSIRINDQYRICFYWNDNNAGSVEIVDYH